GEENEQQDYRGLFAPQVDSFFTSRGITLPYRSTVQRVLIAQQEHPSSSSVIFPIYNTSSTQSTTKTSSFSTPLVSTDTDSVEPEDRKAARFAEEDATTEVDSTAEDDEDLEGA
ncbi:unnamed protein product, partial [Amoebophrya sp. A25]